MRPRIVVIGSINMDFMIRVPRIPIVGETVLGGEFATFPGGKGANQAVAVALLGGETYMVGRVGNDPFGDDLLRSLESRGVSTRYVGRDTDTTTGVAFVIVDTEGNNAIAVAPGANTCVSPQDVDRAPEVIARAHVLLLQLEIPIGTVEYAAQLAHRNDVKIILDPAPATAIPESLYGLIDVLNPNELEAEVLSGIKVRNLECAKQAASFLLSRGVRAVILKLGPNGALLATPSGFRHVPGIPVTAVDTTAAGDAFAGALAVAMAEGKNLYESMVFANYVGALSVTRRGAQPSLPTREEVESFIFEHHSH